MAGREIINERKLALEAPTCVVSIWIVVHTRHVWQAQLCAILGKELVVVKRCHRLFAIKVIVE